LNTLGVFPITPIVLNNVPDLLPAIVTMRNILCNSVPLVTLPPSNNMQYNAYIVVKYIDVQRSIVAPAFGKLGYGIQYKTPLDVNSLIEFKFIIPIK